MEWVRHHGSEPCVLAAVSRLGVIEVRELRQEGKRSRRLTLWSLLLFMARGDFLNAMNGSLFGTALGLHQLYFCSLGRSRWAMRVLSRHVNNDVPARNFPSNLKIALRGVNSLVYQILRDLVTLGPLQVHNA